MNKIKDILENNKKKLVVIVLLLLAIALSTGYILTNKKADVKPTSNKTSDKNGAFTGWTNMLQAGNYAVREIEAPKNYHTAEDVEFAIEHGKTTDVTVSDKEKEPI